jgi:hypothetical protein
VSGADPSGHRSRGVYATGAVLAALLVALLVVVAVRRGGNSDATAASGPAGAPDSSTGPGSSTTSTLTTTKPLATTSSTTTTLPPPIGQVALTETGLVLQYGTPAGLALRFGDEAELTIARIRLLIGLPNADTGWKRDDRCEGSATRRVLWGDLELVFVKGAAGTGDASFTFQQWYVSTPGKSPFGVLTEEHVGIGTTVADLKRAYPSLRLAQPSPGDPAGLFTTKSDGGDLIEGVTTNTSQSGVVAQMWAGFACQRAAS